MTKTRIGLLLSIAFVAVVAAAKVFGIDIGPVSF